MSLEQEYHEAGQNYRNAIEIFDEMVVTAQEHKFLREEAAQNRSSINTILQMLRSIHAESIQYLRDHFEEGLLQSSDFMQELSDLENAVAQNNNDKISEASRKVRESAQLLFAYADVQTPLEKRIDFIWFAGHYIQLARVKIQIAGLTNAFRSPF